MDMKNDAVEYVHPRLNEAVTAIGGHYVLTQEQRTPYERQSLLYIIGHAVIDTSCCGLGGCGYALVPGFVLDWKFKTARDNRPVSLIQPIHSPDVRKNVRRFIKQRECIHTVQFE
jgi:hypothetical protein